MSVVFNKIHDERDRQDAKWGDQSHHPDLYWLAILGEEFGEVAKALLEADTEHIYEELIQVAAVCVSWLEGRIA